MSFFPSPRPVIADEQTGAIEVRDLVEDDADEVFDALGSETARRLLKAIHTEPGTTSELADRIDTSIQNTAYHLENLNDAELIRVAGTQYSDRGREMRIYAAAENPIVFFVGQEPRNSGLFRTLKQLLGAVSIVAGAAVIVHAVLANDLPVLDMAKGGGDGTVTAYLLASALGGLLSLLGAALVRFAMRDSLRLQSRTRTSRSQRVIYEGGPVVVGVVFTASFAFWFARELLGLTNTLWLFEILPWLLTVLVLIAGGLAYRGASLQQCWYIVGAGVAGMLGHELALLPVGYVDLRFLAWIGYILLGAVLLGATLGTVGFTLGRVLRYVYSGFSEILNG